MASVRLSVHLLGRFAVECEGVAVPAEAWKRRRARDLLQVLALAPGRAMHREELIDLLWPEKDLSAGVNNLHRALHDLRGVLGGDWVAAEKGAVRLSDEAWVDVDEFDQALAAGDSARAVALYKGDLCPDEPYAEPLARRREELRQRFSDAALRHGEHAEAAGEDAAALDTLRHLVSVDPSQERAHRALMRLLARAGRRREALLQFALCTRAVREALDEAPSAETQALRDAILRGDAAVAPRRELTGWARLARRLLGTDAPTRLLGRESELEAVREAVGRGEGVLLLFGEAGVGKTRLAVEAARMAEEQGATLLAGATLSGAAAPYAVFAEAFADHVRARSLQPADDPFAAIAAERGSGQDAKLRLFQSVERALRAAAPACLVLDDLQQAEESTLHLFHFLARATRTQRLLLVATCRDEDMAPGSPLHTVLSSLRRERLDRRIAIGRLDREATRELVAELSGGAPDEQTVHDVYRLSAGNPFFTEELVRAWRESGELSVTRDLAGAVQGRVARLGPDAGALLSAASAIGPRFGFDLVRRAVGLPEPAALAALEAALAAQLLEEDGRGYRFRHTLVREALYDALTAARREHLHRGIAAALEPDLAEALAFHHRAGDQPDKALPHLIAAAERAVARAGLKEAVGFYEQALEVMDGLGLPASPQRLRVLERLGQFRVALADLDPAVQVLDAAAALRGPDGWRPSADDRARAYRLAALGLITSGRLEEANERLSRALAGLEEGGAGRELPHVLYHLAQIRWHEGQHREAYVLAERSLAEAERLHDAGSVGRGYEMLALACHSLGEWKSGADFEQRRQELVGGTVDVASAYDVHL